MSLRISSLALLLVAGCNTDTGQGVGPRKPLRQIDCAMAGARDFTPSCTIEPGAGGTTLTLRQADGGFRRLAVATDRQLTAADGADVVVGHALPDGRLEIAVAGNRYRLPGAR